MQLFLSQAVRKNGRTSWYLPVRGGLQEKGIYIWFLKENLNIKNKYFDKIKTRVQSSTLSNFFPERFFVNVCYWFYDKIWKNSNKILQKKFTGNFFNKFYTNLKIVPLFLHFIYLMITTNFFKYLTVFFARRSGKHQKTKK